MSPCESFFSSRISRRRSPITTFVYPLISNLSSIKLFYYWRTDPTTAPHTLALLTLQLRGTLPAISEGPHRYASRCTKSNVNISALSRFSEGRDRIHAITRPCSQSGGTP